MLGTMQDFPLTIGHILRHGRDVHGETGSVSTFEGENSSRAAFSEVNERAERLAKALSRLGIGNGDRVGTFCWNHQQHLEAYLAVPAMGAVLHTLNIRLFPRQLAYVINHAEDRVILVDASLAGLLARVRSELTSVEHLVVIGDGDVDMLGETLSYEEMLRAEEPGYDWPDMDERSAAAMCYTSGTTGDPKGVVYTHRSTFLHSMAITSGATLGIGESDKVLVIVPMFHANAWGTPYAAWMVGADLLMPGRFLQAPYIAKMIETGRPTVSAGVPTIWNDLLVYLETNRLDASSLRAVSAGGSAVPRALIEGFESQIGVPLVQGWGMTETSPVCALALPPKGSTGEKAMEFRVKAGRVVPGVEMRIVAEDGSVLANDGQSIGEIEVRGPWITGSYYKDDASERFHDGWLRTGDVGTVDPMGYMQITDRSKDVIKSGGEWISSLELENAIMAHPAVYEAAVVGVPDERWQERPLAFVVPKPESEVSITDLIEFLRPRVAKWWLPERWAYLDVLPKTSVGKFDKLALRAMYAEGKLHIQSPTTPAPEGAVVVSGENANGTPS
ncbi:MAG: long-chain fatty acid--CoA ligase [Actinomycetota bacterium]|nr:long-chain fatty acid--CoA ligase [Actinomycetota bacterium]